MARQEAEYKFRVGQRLVTVRAYDAVGPEDVYAVQSLAVLHRHVTGEDVWAPAPRDVKDFILRTNLSI